jgi:hypothetical protein
MSNPAHKGSVELFLLSECVGLPTRAGGFKKELYRPTGQVWPYEEFDGPWQIYRFAREVRSMERAFGPGDAIVIRFTTLNTITTLVPLSRQAPVLWNGEHHRIFEQTPGIGDVLLQLPRSFQFQTASRAPHDSDS